MMRKSISSLLLVMSCVVFGDAEAKPSSERKCDPALEDIDPRDRAPSVRIPPAYPEQCIAGAKQKEAVSLKFDVTPEGNTTNIAVTESTNNCLNAASLRSIERWKYTCTPNGLKGVETITTYELKEHASGVSFEREAGCVIYDRSKFSAEGLLSNPRLGASCQSSVSYPLRCVRGADKGEYVDIKFDVSAKGAVKNIDIIKSTNGCFNDGARSSILKRKYAPTEGGYHDIGALFFYDKAETPRAPVCIPIVENDSRRTPQAAAGQEPKPVCTVAPVYPEQCMRRAKKKESVSFFIDVTPSGQVERISLKETSNDCFVAAAKAAASNYRYELSEEGAKKIVVTLTFELSK